MTVLVEKFNPRHDTRGRFASTAAGRIAAGHEVKAQPHEVAAIVDSMHGRSDHPNLTYLNVEGTHLFNRGGKHDREDMPQVPSHRKAEFVDAMKARGVTVARVDVDPLTLKASQGEISGRSVADIFRRERAGTPAITGDAARITISSDGYVLDGHHRWGAHSVMALDGDPVTVPAFRIDLPKDKALQVLRDWNAEADVQSLGMGEKARKAVLTLLEKYNHAHDKRGRFARTDDHGTNYTPMAPEFDEWEPVLQKKYREIASYGLAAGHRGRPPGIDLIELHGLATMHARSKGMDERAAEIYANGVSRRALSSARRNLAENPYASRLPPLDSLEKRSLAKKVDELRADGRVAIAVDEDAAVAIMHDGRFKTQFETNTSNGMLAPRERKAAEVEMFNTHPYTPDKQRPVYGFVAMPGLEGANGVDQYGAVRFVLKPGVKARTTMTVGDSLSTHAMPIPMTGKVTAAQKYDALAIHRPSLRQHFLLADHAGFAGIEYAEAQIHGGVDIADIAEIHVPSTYRRVPGSPGKDRTHPVVQAAEDLGIPVHYYDSGYSGWAFKAGVDGHVIASRSDGATIVDSGRRIWPEGLGEDRLVWIITPGRQYETTLGSALAHGGWEPVEGVAKYNEHHDSRGRFASTGGHGGGKISDSPDSVLAAMTERGWDKGAKPLGRKDFQRSLESGDYVLYYRGGPKGHTASLIEGGRVGGGDLGEGIYITRTEERARNYAGKKGEVALILMPRTMHEQISTPKALTHPPEGSPLHRWRTEHGLTEPWQGGARVGAISVGIPGIANDRGHAGDVLVWNVPDLLVQEKPVRKALDDVMEKRFYVRDGLGRFATTGGGHSTTVDGKPLPKGWTRISDEQHNEVFAAAMREEGVSEDVIARLTSRRQIVPTVYTDGQITVRIGTGPDGLPAQYHERMLKQVDLMQKTAPLDHATIMIDDSYVTTGSGRAVPVGVLGWTSFEHPDKAGHAVIALRPTLWSKEATHSGTIPYNVRTGSDYVVAHEWGHAVVQPKAMGGGKEGSLYQMFGSSAKDVSGYALTSPAEFYAEIFADWHASHGTTTRPVTRKAAKEFGWFGGEDA